MTTQHWDLSGQGGGKVPWHLHRGLSPTKVDCWGVDGIPSKVMEGLSSKYWMKFMIRIQILFLLTGSFSKRIELILIQEIDTHGISIHVASKLPEDRPKLTSFAFVRQAKRPPQSRGVSWGKMPPWLGMIPSRPEMGDGVADEIQIFTFGLGTYMSPEKCQIQPLLGGRSCSECRSVCCEDFNPC